MTARSKLISLAVIPLVAVATVFFLPPIPQDPGYHRFADQRVLLGIPNFWNVVSNLLFIVVGILGLVSVGSCPPQASIVSLRAIYLGFFVGVLLTGIGSGYYHWNPSTETLVWDRLPMTIAFTSFLCIIIGENIHAKTGRALFWPLVLLGLLSVVYWHVTESRGHGDLRPYGLVQFLPVAMVPLVLWWYPSPLSGNLYLWLVVGSFGLAKAAEHFDQTIFDGIGLISGHSIKHIAAAAGTYCFYLALKHRRFADQARTDSVYVGRER